MGLDLGILQNKICNIMCSEVKVSLQSDGLYAIDTPFYFPDGDQYQIYLKELNNGLFKLSDMGHTMMQISYENDTKKLREGTRGKIFDQIKNEFDLEEHTGELYINTRLDDLGVNIFKIGQAITKIYDITFLSKTKVESTFYDELKTILYKIVSEDLIEKDYYNESIDNSTDYPIDYKITGKHAPLYLFGVPNKDKVRITTIVLERLLRAKTDFDSLIIFSDQSAIPKQDLARLSNVGGEMIASLDAYNDISRKILRKI